jgi:hypothetical protein
MVKVPTVVKMVKLRPEVPVATMAEDAVGKAVVRKRFDAPVTAPVVGLTVMVPPPAPTTTSPNSSVVGEPRAWASKEDPIARRPRRKMRKPKPASLILQAGFRILAKPVLLESTQPPMG